MGRQVVMNEKLTAHEEEGEVVRCPSNEEKTSIVPKTIANGLKNRSVMSEKRLVDEN